MVTTKKYRSGKRSGIIYNVLHVQIYGFCGQPVVISSSATEKGLEGAVDAPHTARSNTL